MTLVCTVVKNRQMTTKSNTQMAFTTVEDLTGTMELIVFPRVWQDNHAWLQENAVVVVTGRVSVKEEEAARLLAESVRPIAGLGAPEGQPAVQPKTAAGEEKPVIGLWLLVPGRQSPEMHRIENLLHNIFDGPTPVYFKFEDSGQRVRAPQSLWCNDVPVLRRELERILGENHVKEQRAK